MTDKWIGKRCGNECVACPCGRDRSVKCKWAAAKGWKLKPVRDKKKEKRDKKRKRNK